MSKRKFAVIFCSIVCINTAHSFAAKQSSIGDPFCWFLGVEKNAKVVSAKPAKRGLSKKLERIINAFRKPQLRAGNIQTDILPLIPNLHLRGKLVPSGVSDADHFFFVRGEGLKTELVYAELGKKNTLQPIPILEGLAETETVHASVVFSQFGAKILNIGVHHIAPRKIIAQFDLENRVPNAWSFDFSELHQGGKAAKIENKRILPIRIVHPNPYLPYENSPFRDLSAHQDFRGSLEIQDSPDTYRMISSYEIEYFDPDAGLVRLSQPIPLDPELALEPGLKKEVPPPFEHLIKGKLLSYWKKLEGLEIFTEDAGIFHFTSISIKKNARDLSAEWSIREPELIFPKGWQPLQKSANHFPKQQILLLGNRLLVPVQRNKPTSDDQAKFQFVVFDLQPITSKNGGELGQVQGELWSTNVPVLQWTSVGPNRLILNIGGELFKVDLPKLKVRN